MLFETEREDFPMKTNKIIENQYDCFRRLSDFDEIPLYNLAGTVIQFFCRQLFPQNEDATRRGVKTTVRSRHLAHVCVIQEV